MKLTCQRCGAAAERCGGTAKYCLPCAGIRRPRIASADRRRHGVYKPLRLPGGFGCLDCGAAVAPVIAKRRAALRCAPCRRVRLLAMSPARSAAASIVAAAIRRGAIPRADSYYCTDCGRPAEAYDHRDYTRPLDIDPVCRSCNVIRGPAHVWLADVAERPEQSAA